MSNIIKNNLGHIVKVGATKKWFEDESQTYVLVGSGQEEKLTKIILDDEETNLKNPSKGLILKYDKINWSTDKYCEGKNISLATNEEKKFYESKEARMKKLKLVLSDEATSEELYLAFARSFEWLLQGGERKEGILGNTLFAYTHFFGIPMAAFRAQLNGDAKIVSGTWTIGKEEEDPGDKLPSLLQAAWDPKYVKFKPLLENVIKEHLPEFKSGNYQ